VISAAHDGFSVSAFPLVLHMTNLKKALIYEDFR